MNEFPWRVLAGLARRLDPREPSLDIRYNSAVWTSPSEDALGLHATRLLEEFVRKEVGRQNAKVVFIFHSFGGVLVKSVRQLLPFRTERIYKEYRLSEGYSCILKEPVGPTCGINYPAWYSLELQKGSGWAN